jgi:predicted RNase H-like HicB family nuclease
MNLKECLAIPYMLDVRSVEGPDGKWVCRVAYEELPGCVATAESPLKALDALERIREKCIVRQLEKGLPVPVPRAPLGV